MISVTGVTNNYVLQPALLEKHAKTLAWLSATALWKSELTFFQRQLDGLSALSLVREDRSEVTHFQNLVLFYTVEVIEDMRKKLRNHESRLARMLETKSEWETQYYKEHGELMDEADALSDRFEKLKTDLRTAIGKLSTENDEDF
jgi:DNA repair exonuclease SbcCD ATPase subunit